MLVNLIFKLYIIKYSITGLSIRQFQSPASPNLSTWDPQSFILLFVDFVLNLMGDEHEVCSSRNCIRDQVFVF